MNDIILKAGMTWNMDAYSDILELNDVLTDLFLTYPVFRNVISLTSINLPSSLNRLNHLTNRGFMIHLVIKQSSQTTIFHYCQRIFRVLL